MLNGESVDIKIRSLIPLLTRTFLKLGLVNILLTESSQCILRIGRVHQSLSILSQFHFNSQWNLGANPPWGNLLLLSSFLPLSQCSPKILAWAGSLKTTERGKPLQNSVGAFPLHLLGYSQFSVWLRYGVGDRNVATTFIAKEAFVFSASIVNSPLYQHKNHHNSTYFAQCQPSIRWIWVFEVNQIWLVPANKKVTTWLGTEEKRRSRVDVRGRGDKLGYYPVNRTQPTSLTVTAAVDYFTTQRDMWLETGSASLPHISFYGPQSVEQLRRIHSSGS